MAIMMMKKKKTRTTTRKRAAMGKSGHSIGKFIIEESICKLPTIF